jgi:hypothetical protein
MVRILLTTPILAATAFVLLVSQEPERRWLAGDTHIHSQWSAAYDRTVDPPTPIRGMDAIYSTPLNAMMAREHGLDWMVTTDHGGPNHSKFNLEQAYPELKRSRVLVPDILQFYGMELNMPAMDHHTLIIPRADDEDAMLFEIESRFDQNEPWPQDPERRTEAQALAALAYMKTLPRIPLMFANHPSRSATGIGVWGVDEPRELRANNDMAPDIYRGLEGGPGHQAAGLDKDGQPRRDDEGEPAGFRGGYSRPGAQTLGGFDQMAAIVGGVWDSMLGEGRRFWIVASSDSHVHYTDPIRPSSDFWPGEFHKTYVWAHKTYEDVLDGLRAGRMFAVAGGLITELDLSASAGGGTVMAGGAVQVKPGDAVRVRIRFRDPDVPNASGDNPSVQRVDIIVGEVTGPVEDQNAASNPTTRVVERFARADMKQDGEVFTIETTLPASDRDRYVRIRGTNTADLEPVMDGPGQDPWKVLWFYSNPIFIEVAAGSN